MTKISETDIQRVRSTVVGLVDEYHLPGISVGVVAGEELVYAEGFGYADIETGRPQDPSLRQRIGSITKTMLALCTMALVDEGKLALDDRVVDRLPDIAFDGPAETLAIRHLMTHTGGIGEAPTMAHILEPYKALWSDVPDVPPISEAYPDGITIEVAPGTKWAYANHGYGLLGEIVARIEGSPIEDVLQSRVFEPLGMNDTDCLDQPHPDLTTGYHRPPSHEERDMLDVMGKEPDEEETADGWNIRGKYVYVRPRAAGAVQSTIPDMARYATALLRKSGGIVRPETFENMTAPHWCPDERLLNLGLTFFRSQRFGRWTFGHGGGVAGGWNTNLTVIPEEDLAVLIHLNLSSDLMAPVTSRIVQAVLDAPTPTFPESPPALEIIATAPGVYELTPGHLTNVRPVRTTGRIQIASEDGGLVLRSRRDIWREGVRMLPADPADPAFFALDTGDPEPPFVALILDERNAVTGMRLDRLVRMVKNDSLEPWA